MFINISRPALGLGKSAYMATRSRPVRTRHYLRVDAGICGGATARFLFNEQKASDSRCEGTRGEVPNYALRLGSRLLMWVGF